MSELAFISGDRKQSIFVLKSILFVNFNYCSERLTFLGDVPVCCLYVCIFIVLI